MPKFAALKIAKERAGAGMAGDILEMIADAYFVQGLSLQESIDSVQEQLTDRAIARYGDKIRAALGRAGLDLPEGDVTLDAIKTAITEKSGLDLDNLTPEAMAQAVDGLAARKLSDALGVEVATVATGAGLADAVKAGVSQAIADGRAADLLGRGLTTAARAKMTWSRAGITTEQEQKTVANWVYQKRYRRHHVEVWD